MLCTMNDLMYYGRLAWTGVVNIRREGDLIWSRSCYVLLLTVPRRVLACKHAFREC